MGTQISCDESASYRILAPRTSINCKTLRFGSGIPVFEATCGAEPLTPTGVRRPECILGASPGLDQVIWSFGCLVYQVFTGYPLFTIAGYEEGEEDEADDDHLMQFSSILGPLSGGLRLKWSRYHLHFDFNGRAMQLRPVRPVTSPSEDESDDPGFAPLEDMFRQYKRPDADEAEATVVKNLLRSISQYHV